MNLLVKTVNSIKKNGLKITLYRVVYFLRLKLFGKLYPYIFKKFSPLIVCLIPSRLSFFVGGCPINLDTKYHKRLPKIKNRLPYGKSFMDDFTIIDIDAPVFSEVNIIFRGERGEDKINRSIPTLFLNPVDLNVTEGFKDVYLITADIGVLGAFLGYKKGNPLYPKKYAKHNVIFIKSNWFFDERFDIASKDINVEEIVKYSKKLENIIFREEGCRVHEKYKSSFVLHHSEMKNLHLGSGIGCLVYAINNSEKLNVYGWDQYLDENLSNQFFKQIYSLWSHGNSIGPFATNLINWMYAYRILNELSCEKINIKGKINQIRDMHWIKKKVMQVMYKNLH
jgi:hypothetical protein